jgi:hypothetical protein
VRPEPVVVDLGSFVGHCPECALAAGSLEMGLPCSRCGNELNESTLLDSVIAVTRQNGRQAASATPWPNSWQRNPVSYGRKPIIPRPEKTC